MENSPLPRLTARGFLFGNYNILIMFLTETHWISRNPLSLTPNKTGGNKVCLGLGPSKNLVQISPLTLSFTLRETFAKGKLWKKWNLPVFLQVSFLLSSMRLDPQCRHSTPPMCVSAIPGWERSAAAKPCGPNMQLVNDFQRCHARLWHGSNFRTAWDSSKYVPGNFRLHDFITYIHMYIYIYIYLYVYV